MRIDDVLRYVLAVDGTEDDWCDRGREWSEYGDLDATSGLTRLLKKLRVMSGVGALRALGAEKCAACSTIKDSSEAEYIAFMENK